MSLAKVMSYANDMPQLTALESELRTAVLRLARRLRQERSDATLTQTQISALISLARHGSLTPAELADHERVQRPSMTRVVAALEDAGMVQRRPHPSDGRQVLLTLTERAEAMLTEDRQRRDAWLAGRVDALPDADRVTLRDAAEIMLRLASS